MGNVYKVDDALAEVRTGYYRSIYLHGDWEGYRAWMVLWVVIGEVWELVWAMIRLDRDGKHGVVNEMKDVAVVSLKALLWFRRRI